MADTVTSRRSQITKKVRRLKKRTFRDRDGLFLVEGLRVTREAIRRQQGVVCLLFTESQEPVAEGLSREYRGGLHKYLVAEKLMEDISATVHNQGVMAIVEQLHVTPGYLEEKRPSLVLVLDRVRDPGNMGALIRVADAAGADCVAVIKGSVDIYNPKVVRAAAGSHFHVPMLKDLVFNDAVRMLKDLGIKVMALDARKGLAHYDADLSEPVALVVGNEAHGFPDQELRLVDEVIHIPMPGEAESMNAATAASVVLFESVRQRRVDEK